MSGVLGWIGIRADEPRALISRMAGGASEAADAFDVAAGPGYAMAVRKNASPAILHEADGRILALQGHPAWRENREGSSDLSTVASKFLDAFARHDLRALASLDGDYALALIEPARGRIVLAIDRMSVRNIVHAEAGGGLVFGPTCDALVRHPDVRSDIDPQGIFNYLHFHMVPGPETVYRGVRRIPPGHHLDRTNGRSTIAAHWRPAFREDAAFDFDRCKGEFRTGLERSVRTLSQGTACGAFLSGGTDSSTLAGLLGRTTGVPARTFSIGFDAAGYDEMGYARIAATHFGTDQHEYYVTPDDVVAAIPRIAAIYDQPFGNASAIPTFHCAKLARDHGVQRMLGGDGGDELYGGNTRYAKQYQFAWYERIPASLRSQLIEPLAARLPLTGQLALLRKARSYVAQASLPMPDRYESYNLLERLGHANVLTGDFLATVDPSAPKRRMREVWQAADATSLINRMLALDFQFTLADNDLPKVTRMCELAGVDVAFPMLSTDVIDLSLDLPPGQKLRGSELRYFFKQALADFLPSEIIAKEKHGFGLPVGNWLLAHRPLHALAADTLSSLRRRGIVRPEFIDRLLGEHLASHPAYYGSMVWILVMLESWYGRQSSP